MHNQSHKMNHAYFLCKAIETPARACILFFCLQVADADIAFYRQPLSQACLTCNHALGKLKKKKERIVRPNTLDTSSLFFLDV